jgi:ribose 5-phosphate isomerase A
MREEAKKRAAERAVEFVEDGQVVGLGTGSTTKFAIEKIGERVREGLKLRGVPTSQGSDRLAKQLGIQIVDLNDVERINITIDGADEIDPNFHMIKGGGGALTREKLVALSSNLVVIVVDDPKLVSTLGETRALPVEVLPFAWRMTSRLIEQLGCRAVLRSSDGATFVTDNSNYILDCEFGPIADPVSLEKAIKLLPGVVECGLFINIANVVVIAFEESVEVRKRPTG